MVGLRLQMLVLAISAAVMSTPALADVSKLPGMTAYQNGDFTTAARELQKAIPTLTGEDRMHALMYLSAARFAKGRVHDTQESLAQLYQEFADATLDPNVFDPDLIALSRRVQTDARARRNNLTPPEEKKDETAVAVVEQQQGRGPLPYVASGGAALALGASLYFVTSANRQKSALDGSFGEDGHSGLTYPDAQRLRDGANRDMTLALVSGVTTAALTGVAVWLWTRNDP